MNWLFILRSSLSRGRRVNRLWVSSSLGLLPFRGLKLRLHVFSFDPVVKSLLFIFSELHVLILLILLILKLHDLTWAQMPHSLLDRHFHDLGERQFISILRNEFDKSL